MKNKNVVIVTGGSNGIGLAIVKKFISSDNVVISADLKRENLINNKNYIFKSCDVQSEKSINELIDFVLKKFGKINYFFSNAGILNIGDEQSSDTNWEKNWKINPFFQTSKKWTSNYHFVSCRFVNTFRFPYLFSNQTRCDSFCWVDSYSQLGI